MKITIKTTTGATVVGNLAHKQGTTLAVICYGYKGTPKHPAITTIVAELNKQGFATFVFWFSAKLPIDIQGQVADVQAIVEHFKGRFGKITLLSSSLGALSSCVAVLRSPGIHGLVTLNGFFGLPHLGGRARREFLLFRLIALLPGKYRQVWNFYKREFKPSAISVPTLVLHCPTDNQVLISQSHYFYNQLKAPKEFQKIALADHNLTKPQDAYTIAKVMGEWLKRLS